MEPSKDNKILSWHSINEEEIMTSLNASSDGLNSGEAQIRKSEHGPNELEAEEAISPFLLFMHQFHNPLIYLLIAASMISFLTGHATDAIVIGTVVILNAILGFVQEWRAEGALAALQKMSAPKAKILRDGVEQKIPASEIVPGDIMLLETGDRVAGDARIISIQDLQVDEAALTGESEPVRKKTGTLTEDTPLADRTNMVWMTTVITQGRGKAIVTQTGMNTQIGRIAGEVRKTSREKTPLQKKMEHLSVILGVGGVVLAILVFVTGILRGYDFVTMLLFSVAAAVAAIPEGLPAVISVILALGVQRLARNNAIVRRLPAVETLGSTTVICSDKTGTITKSQMTVKQIWAGEKFYEVSGDGYAPNGTLKPLDKKTMTSPPEELKKLLEIGILANNAALKQKNEQWQVQGNPSEGALLVALLKSGMDQESVKASYPRVHEIPFSSEYKYMATLHQTSDHCLAFVKGAPDRVLNFCGFIFKNGDVFEISNEERKKLLEINEVMASKALRVLAGAYARFPKEKKEISKADVEKNLVFCGFWGMMDPPRTESIVAVKEAKQAGIRPIMITGDHSTTALAIAKQIGIFGNGEVLTGKEIDSLNKKELAEKALEAGVFARVSPAHKLKILESLKEKGDIVAMTGDGVNDAPALKGADIGIAMGKAGTEVAREAADMILLDDNFATIVHAIEEGRVIYNNLRRVVFFLVSTNIAEILTLVAALSIGLDMPLTAVMILWVNLVTDGACTIPLGVEPMHENILSQPPRKPDTPIINKRMIERMLVLTPVMAFGTLLLFLYELRTGTYGHAQTVAFTTLAAFQWFQVFNARSELDSVFSLGFFRNKWLLLGLGIAIVLQLTVIYSPFAQNYMGTVPLSLADWMLIIVVSSSVWIVDETLKIFRRRKEPKDKKS